MLYTPAKHFKGQKKRLLIPLFQHLRDHTFQLLISLYGSRMPFRSPDQSILPPFSGCRICLSPPAAKLHPLCKGIRCSAKVIRQGLPAGFFPFLRHPEKGLRRGSCDRSDIRAAPSHGDCPSQDIFKIRPVQKSGQGGADTQSGIRGSASAQHLPAHGFLFRDPVSEFLPHKGSHIILCTAVKSQEDQTGGCVRRADCLFAAVCERGLKTRHMAHHVEVILKHPGDRTDPRGRSSFSLCPWSRSLPEQPDTRIHGVAGQGIGCPETPESRCQFLRQDLFKEAGSTA